MEDGERIGEVANEYFGNLFTSSNLRADDIQQAIQSIGRRVSDKHREEMRRPFTKLEIEKTLRSMKPTKAPGPDGAHALFFQSYWDIVGEDVSKVCLKILNEEKDLSPLN